jgi:broad specificity phosphatase PhoE
MRQIYTSPRQDNIDRVVALLTEHGIETTVTNRSNWNRPSYQRFSYSQRNDDRSAWPQVWVKGADDFPKARALLKEIGIEPVVRFQEELQLHRKPDNRPRAQRTAARVRLMVLAIVAGVMLVAVLRATQVL